MGPVKPIIRYILTHNLLKFFVPAKWRSSRFLSVAFCVSAPDSPASTFFRDSAINFPQRLANKQAPIGRDLSHLVGNPSLIRLQPAVSFFFNVDKKRPIRDGEVQCGQSRALPTQM